MLCKSAKRRNTLSLLFAGADGEKCQQSISICKPIISHTKNGVQNQFRKLNADPDSEYRSVALLLNRQWSDKCTPVQI